MNELVKRAGKGDRRRSKRVHVKMGTYASFDSNALQFGEILDISPDGVALRIPFPENTDTPSPWSVQDGGNINISLFSMNGTAILNLPVRTVSLEVKPDHTVSRTAFLCVESARKAMIKLFIQMFKTE